MALTKSTIVDQIVVNENGSVSFREVTRILEDGVELSKTYNRTGLSPNQDVSSYPANVQTICNAAWTPEVVAAYQVAQEAK
jgi:hypothetical protein